MKIDIAVEADIPALNDLLSLLFSQEEEFTPDPVAQARGLSQIISHPDVGAVLVVRLQGRVVAMVNILFTVSTALGMRVALLEDMVVTPEYRGSGCGSLLLSHAIGFARDQGCGRITLLTDESNEVAQRFYGKQGFTISTMLPMRLSLL